MPYSPQTWANGSGGSTPIDAARLNHMEDGIAAAAELAIRGDGFTLSNGDIWTASASPQSIANATWTDITSFAHSDFTEADSYMQMGETVGSVANGSLRFLSNGYYEIGWDLEWDDSNTTGSRYVSIEGDSGTPDIGMYGYIDRQCIAASAIVANGGDMYGVKGVWISNPNREVFISVWQNSGSAVNVTYAELWAKKIF